jgi:hypothetical protein
MRKVANRETSDNNDIAHRPCPEIDFFPPICSPLSLSGPALAFPNGSGVSMFLDFRRVLIWATQTVVAAISRLWTHHPTGLVLRGCNL